MRLDSEEGGWSEAVLASDTYWMHKKAILRGNAEATSWAALAGERLGYHVMVVNATREWVAKVLYYVRVVPAPVPVDLEDGPEEEQPPVPLLLAIVQYYAWRISQGEVLRADPRSLEVSAADGSPAHAHKCHVSSISCLLVMAIQPGRAPSGKQWVHCAQYHACSRS